MINYSLPRRIWRIIYPALLFLAIQFLVGALIVVFAAVAVIVQAVAGAAAGVTDAAVLMEVAMRLISENTIVIVFISNIATLSVFLPMWLITRSQAERYKRASPVVTGLLTAGFFAGFNIIQMVIFGLTDVMKYFPSYDEVNDVFAGGSFAMLVVSVGIAAPIVEELVFRGVLINRMKWLPVWAAVAIQGVLFGVVHLNLFQSLYAAIAGVLLGLVYVKYRSIIIAIIGHMAYNLASVLLGEFLTEDNAVIVLLVCPVVTVVCAVLLIRRGGAVRAGGTDDGAPSGGVHAPYGAQPP